MFGESLIVIIDDGVNEKWMGINLYKDLEVSADLKIINRVHEYACDSHGSICAKIIDGYTKCAQLISIKVLDSKSHTGSIEQLVKALNWCLENNIKLINLSLGTYHYVDYKTILPIINALVDSGCLIIAACGKDCMSVPASIAGVIGVMADREYKLNTYMMNRHIRGPMFWASSSHILDEGKVTKCANSYAAPVVTSMIYNTYSYSKRMTIFDIMENENASEKYVNHYKVRRRLDFINDAVIIGDNQKILKEYIYFNVINWNRDFDVEKQQYIYDGKVYSLIIIPPTHIDSQWIKHIYDIINENNSCIKGIAYLGKPNKMIKLLLHSTKKKYIWYEKANIIIDSKSSRLIEVVYVKISGCSGLKAAIELMREMQKEYNIIVLSDISYSYLYGWEYLDSSKNIEQQILMYESIYLFDIIFIVSDNDILKTPYLFQLTIADDNVNCNNGFVITLEQIEEKMENCVQSVCEWINAR